MHRTSQETEEPTNSVKEFETLETCFFSNAATPHVYGPCWLMVKRDGFAARGKSLLWGP